MKYKEEVMKAMEMFGKDDRTIFIGQTVGYSGSAMFGSLENVPTSKRIELPIMEDTQMGIGIGLALEGFIPISVYPRFDFVILTMNQLVNHLDKIEEMSCGRFKPKVIIRTMVGSKKPLDGGSQHTSDYTEGFKVILKNIDVVRLEKPEDIFPAYKKALESDRSTLFIEISDLYHEVS